MKNDSDEVSQISGLPKNPKISNLNWSPDQSKIAFTNTAEDGVNLWILDLNSASAKKVSDLKLNANIGSVINWFSDSKSLLIKVIPKDKPELINSNIVVQVGPKVSTNFGKKQNRTYQDLLKNKVDEHNFQQLVTSDLFTISINGKAKKWLESNMY